MKRRQFLESLGAGAVAAPLWAEAERPSPAARGLCLSVTCDETMRAVRRLADFP